MKNYIDLLKDIKENGKIKQDRTGTGTVSVFGRQLRFNLGDGFPLLTTKKMAWKPMLVELLWFLKGRTDLKYLVDNKCYIWVGDAYKRYCNTNSDLNREQFIDKIKNDDDFSQKWGNLGKIYGYQWRNWNGVDQINDLINNLNNNPDSRRLMVSAWNTSDLGDMILPPCHYGFQCYTEELTFDERFMYFLRKKPNETTHIQNGDFSLTMDKMGIPKRKLSLMFNMRSVDVPLGLPFNIGSYALLLLIISKSVNMIPSELICNLGDAHIYINQLDGVDEQLKRDPLKLPMVKINDKLVGDISEYGIDDFELIDYISHDTIKFPLSN